jgi:hypothetical protein
MRSSSARRSRQSGSVLILVTLMVPFLVIPLVGLAIDASVARLTQLKLQAAVDGAAIGAGRLLGAVADNKVKPLAEEFLASNFRTDKSAGTWGTYNLTSTVVYTPGITKKIDITARAWVPLLFLRSFFHFTDVMVAAAGTATRTDSRVMVVIDRSGSMTSSDGAGSTVIADAKLYASAFTGKFTEGSDELGLVVFDGSGFVAYPHLNPNWDPTITKDSTGGPDVFFNDPTDANNMVAQIGNISANNGQTGTAEALWLAYMELQKTHLKDLAADGNDFRLNSIVMLTDGLPQSMTVWPNNPAPNGNALLSASTCVNRIVPPTLDAHGNIIVAGNPNPTPMLGWIAVSRPFSSSAPLGLYQLASRDPAATHTSVWWVGQPQSDEEALNPATAGGCTGLQPIPGNLGSAAKNDFDHIPATDMWGNLTSGSAYKTASQFIDANGNVVANPLNVALTFDNTQVTSGDHWALAFWNATDSAAQRIRADVNLANRAGDVQNMKIAIYVIGYSGNAPGNDQGLLKRVANDISCPTYDSTKATGLYVQAGNKTALANAFNTVYNAILRLAK